LFRILTMKTLRIAVAQINPVVGDLKGNKKKILSFIKKAGSYAPDIIVFPELALTGYPPEDLLLKPHFIKDCGKYLKEIVKENMFPGILILGYVEGDKNNVYNAAAVIHKHRIAENYRKIKLPNYGVFDEKRYFTSGDNPLAICINDIKVGITICEDVWVEDSPYILRSLSNADLIVNISASPYHIGKINQRIKLLRNISGKYRFDIIYANLIGGQDELVFDGASMAVSSGRVKTLAGQFKEDLIVYDAVFEKNKKKKFPQYVRQKSFKLKNNKKRVPLKTAGYKLLDEAEEVYSALVLGMRDYVEKNGFKKAIIGLSGGIDSAITAVIASDALGCENILGVAMPSMYSSRASLKDAELLASNLGIELIKIPITDIYKSYLQTFKPIFDNLPFDKTEENIQARIRGNILMALSNKFGSLVITTGNKSEASTGYCTLYGDMAGGFAVIKDVTKTLIYKLALWRNKSAKSPLIPESILRKAPSAELRPNQKDQDTLPEYKILDEIILRYIEKDNSLDEIVKSGYSKKLTQRIIRMIDNNEYKRRQAPPGIRISPKAFGKDRRMPITCGYKI